MLSNAYRWIKKIQYYKGEFNTRTNRKLGSKTNAFFKLNNILFHYSHVMTYTPSMYEFQKWENRFLRYTAISETKQMTLKYVQIMT